MTKVIADITTSLDGVTGAGADPLHGLGDAECSSTTWPPLSNPFE